MGCDAVVLKVKDTIDEGLPLFTDCITSMRLDSIERKQKVSALFTEHPTPVLV